jgi:hypothetical protein
MANGNSRPCRRRHLLLLNAFSAGLLLVAPNVADCAVVSVGGRAVRVAEARDEGEQVGSEGRRLSLRRNNVNRVEMLICACLLLQINQF